jgi:hypothetical protein
VLANKTSLKRFSTFSKQSSIVTLAIIKPKLSKKSISLFKQANGECNEQGTGCRLKAQDIKNLKPCSLILAP